MSSQKRLNALQYMPNIEKKCLVQFKSTSSKKLLLSVLIGTEDLRFMNSFHFIFSCDCLVLRETAQYCKYLLRKAGQMTLGENLTL